MTPGASSRQEPVNPFGHEVKVAGSDEPRIAITPAASRARPSGIE